MTTAASSFESPSRSSSGKATDELGTAVTKNKLGGSVFVSLNVLLQYRRTQTIETRGSIKEKVKHALNFPDSSID